MPGSRISKGDIFDDSFFNALKDANKELKTVLTTFKQLATEARAVSKGVQAAKTFDDLSKKAAAAGKSIKDLTAEEKRLARATQELAFQQSDAGKKLAQINHEKNKAAKANRDLAKSQDAAKKSTNSWGKALGSFQFKFNALGNAIAAFAQQALRRLTQVMKKTFAIVVDFDQAMADVKAVTKASKVEFDLLSNSAQQLGGSTKFTATQVAQLQKEYAKLGFTTKEILNAQAATLDLAAATNTELPRAAEVVGITIRQFGLGAEEAKRVTDVMAQSFSSSALDMEKFAESMKFVGPAAKASGISLERTTAILGQLADAGISGSMAGTSLRQIMLALSKETGTFSEKIERAAEKGLDLAGASEEVQKRAATALLVLADGVDTVDDYTESLEDAAGASQEMADTQLDTLQGKITLVKSAWEGMILAMLNTEGNLSGVKWALEGIVDILNAFALRAQTGIKLSEALAIEKAVDDITEWAIETDKANESLDVFVDGFKNVKENFKGFGKELLDTILPKPEEMKEAVESGYVETISTIEAELDNLKEKRKNVSLEEIGAINREIKALEKKIEVYKNFGEKLPKLLEVTDDMEIDLDSYLPDPDEFLEQYSTTKEDQSEIDREYFQRWREMYDEAHAYELEQELLLRDTKMAIASEGFNFAMALLDNKIQNIEQQEAAGVISTKKAEEEKAKIRRKQAIIDKAQAIFGIIINTALAVTKVMGQTGIISPFLIPAIIALGALQAATVIAQPIPQFSEGTDAAPGGISIVGEKGKELMIGPDGKIGLTPDSATLMDIQKGTKIIPSDVTNELLRYTAIANGLSGDKDDRVILAVMQKIDQSNERLYRAIKEKPVSSSILTPAGIRTLTYKGNTVIKKMDKYFK